MAYMLTITRMLSEKPPGERSFFKDTTSLLLEGMRRLDEVGTGSGVAE